MFCTLEESAISVGVSLIAFTLEGLAVIVSVFWGVSCPREARCECKRVLKYLPSKTSLCDRECGLEYFVALRGYFMGISSIKRVHQSN